MQLKRPFVKISDSKNIWVYKGKFFQVIKDKSKNIQIYVFNKYKNGGPTDFLFSTNNYMSLFYTLQMLNEKFDFPIIPELHPSYKEVCQNT